MNEQANKAIVELLQKASSGIDSTVAFSQAQLPDVIHQLLMWKITIGVIWSVIGLALIVLAVLIPLWAKRARAKGSLWTYHDANSAYNISSITYDFSRSLFPALVLFSGVIIVFGGLTSWLKILLAPKLYLIEYAASLIK